MNYNDKILDLLSGNLTKEETISFREEIKHNEKLKEDIKFQKEVMDMINRGDDDTIEFRRELNLLGKEFMEEQSSKVIMRPGYWLAAASVVTLLSITTFLGLFKTKNINTDQLFIEYYTPYKLNLNVRGDNTELKSIDKAIQLYENGNITSALSVFKRLETQNTELAGFFSSLCYMELGKIDESKIKLETIQNKAIFYAEDIDWYLALCYLKKNEISAAKDLLSQIIASKSQYSAKANEVYKRLL